MHDVAVALDMAVVLDAHGARHADPAEVVAAKVYQHQMFGAFLLVGQQLLFEKLVLVLGAAAPPGTSDGVRRRPAILDRHQCLRTGADDGKRCCTKLIRDIEQIHVRARIGHPQHPVHVNGIGVGVDLETL